jgi:flagellar FliJ protein
MKNFKFSIQSVLDLKTKFEENEKTKLLKLKNELNALFDDLAALKSLFENSKRKHKEMSAAGTSTAKFAEMTWYLKEIDNKITLKNNEIDKMQEKIEIQTDVLKEINKEVKMLEKLREKQVLIHNKLVDKENELIVDDFIAGKSLRE